MGWSIAVRSSDSHIDRHEGVLREQLPAALGEPK
jgi:hypothetical protein